MLRTVTAQIEGVSPLMTHNGRLANPRERIAQEAKKITGNKKLKESDEGMAMLDDLHWYGALYLDENERPCIPGENIESMMIAAAKRTRKGKAVEAAVMSYGLWSIDCTPKLKTEPFAISGVAGFRPIEKLYAQFRDVRMGRIPPRTGARVSITRPFFRSWALTFDLTYQASAIDEEPLRDMLVLAGQEIGLGDYRPKYGRFEVASWQPEAASDAA